MQHQDRNKIMTGIDWVNRTWGYFVGSLFFYVMLAPAILTAYSTYLVSDSVIQDSAMRVILGVLVGALLMGLGSGGGKMIHAGNRWGYAVVVSYLVIEGAIHISTESDPQWWILSIAVTIAASIAYIASPTIEAIMNDAKLTNAIRVQDKKDDYLRRKELKDARHKNKLAGISGTKQTQTKPEQPTAKTMSREQKIAEAKRLKSENVPQNEIASRLEVNPSTITRWLRD